MNNKNQFFDLQPILEELGKNKKIAVSGLFGSALSLFVYELTRNGKKVVLITTPDKKDSYFTELVRLVPSAILVDENRAFFEPATVVVTSTENLEMTVSIREIMPVKSGGHVDTEDLLFRLDASGFTR